MLDAPVQMRRETEALRAAAGKAGDTDLEPMLQAAASAWPPNRPAVDRPALRAGPPDTRRERLQQRGDRAVPRPPAAGRLARRTAEGRLVLSRAAPAKAS